MLKSDVKAYINPKYIGKADVTATGQGDDSEVTGESIDRLGYDSVDVQFPYSVTLSSGETFSLAIEYQESSDDSNWDSAQTLRADSVVKTATADDTYTGVVSEGLNLKGKKRYIRFNFTPDLSVAATSDTLEIMGVANLGGSDKLEC